jgi:hypothetical protein
LTKDQGERVALGLLVRLGAKIGRNVDPCPIEVIMFPEDVRSRRGGVCTRIQKRGPRRRDGEVQRRSRRSAGS